MIYETTTLHERIYRFLQANALIRSSAEYSRLMGRSRTYYNTLRQQSRRPSPAAWANLIVALTHFTDAPVQPATKAMLRQFMADIGQDVRP